MTPGTKMVFADHDFTLLNGVPEGAPEGSFGGKGRTR